MIKFRALRERALDLGCDAMATGHYARLLNPASGNAPAEPGSTTAAMASLAPGARPPQLWTARDQSKDQSYFLR